MRGLVIVVVLALAGTAYADNKVAAEDLFTQAKQLEKDGKLAEACDAYAKSQDLDPQLGTEYNLALCDEKLGRTATAWGYFRELAQRDTNKKRKKDADARATKLASKLTRVLITIQGPSYPGLVVKLGDDDVTEIIGVATAVDPADYTLTASAPGYQTFTSKVSASGEGATVTVTIPVLEPEAKETPVVPPPPPPDHTVAPVVVKHATSRGGGRKRLGMILGGGGLAIAVTGGVFGVLARGKWNDAEAVCGPDHACATQADLDRSRTLAHDASGLGNLSTALVAGGAAVLATGVVLWLTAPSGHPPDEHALNIVPMVDANGAYVSIGGAL
jgi:hypothetical protein